MSTHTGKLCPSCGGELERVSADRWDCGYGGHTVIVTELIEDADESNDFCRAVILAAIQERSGRCEST